MEGSLVANRYVVNGIIGSGGMAIVYRGYDRDTGTEVAIKVLRSEFMQDDAYVRRFEKESQIATKYSHKNIVKTIEVGCNDGRHYIVMEYVTGMTLKEYISKHGRLRPAEAIRVGRQICDALFYAHSHQLVHRDIKPQNILLTSEGIVKVADFGIAKAAETSTVTISGSNVLGSVHYISPEQARGAITDEKTDIYSIGIVLYEMVTGSVPFTGDTPVAVALKHLQDAPRPPREIAPEIPKAMELVILKAISKEQSMRYDNAREMARDLERSILEPEGSYIKIRQPDESEGTRPMHPIKVESMLAQSNGTYSTNGQTGGNTGPTRRPPPRTESHWRRQKKPLSAMNVLLAVLLAVVLLGSAYIGIKAILDGATPKVKVPQLIGMNIDTAKKQLDSLQLKYVINEEVSEKFEPGYVFYQSYGEDSYITIYDTIILTVSTGRQQVSIPDVTDMSLEEAKLAIEKKGLSVGNVRNEASEKIKNTVIRQDPLGGTMLAIGGMVDLWISQGQSASPEMPNVFGMTKDEATKLLLDDYNIQVSKVLPRASTYLADTVVGQKPEVGTVMDPNTEVELYVSTGVPPGYHKEYAMQFTVSTNGTSVKIVFVDGEAQNTVYPDTEMNAGTNDLTINLDSLTLGEKTLILYFDNVEQRRETVTFEAGDAYTK